MLRRISFLWLACAALASAPVLGAEPPAPGARQVVALPEFESEGASEIEIAAATDRMQEELLATGRFEIVDRAQFEAALKEQARRKTECEGRNCALLAGKELGARKAVMGKVTRTGDDQWAVSASLVDIDYGLRERTSTVYYQGAYIILLRDGMPILAARLAGTKPPEAPGFVARVEDESAPPILPSRRTSGRAARPAPEAPPGPASGFAFYFGGQSLAGEVRLKDGRSLSYASNEPIIGLDYQWFLAGFFTVAAFLESGGERVQGQMADFYSDTTSQGIGVEIRYWRSPWFYTASLADYFTQFHNYNARNGTISEQELNLDGISIGLGLGYDLGRWYVSGIWDSIDMLAKAPEDPAFPQAKSAHENRVRIRFGYRWKKD